MVDTAGRRILILHIPIVRILIVHIPIILIPIIHKLFGRNVDKHIGVGMAMLYVLIILVHQVMDMSVEEIVVRIPVAHVIVVA